MDKRESYTLETAYQLAGVVDTMLRLPDDEDSHYVRRSLTVRADQLTGELIWLLSDDNPGVPDNAEKTLFGYRRNPPEPDTDA